MSNNERSVSDDDARNGRWHSAVLAGMAKQCRGAASPKKAHVSERPTVAAARGLAVAVVLLGEVAALASKPAGA